ncbi:MULTISPECIES: hypothetical protein [unclassified Streptomyces]|uniref:hypothetical protein n=1 Tax=unclassified Streptomyces TaxID=2593676 RepID=UPI00225277B1|nr:hypothetical protein [Streptomyces sp. NBC_01264]MCX4784102.1 hypothetical protein [Streptomyces sp. NBC_01264]
MSAPHATRRARLRSQLTGETVQQAHTDLTGADGVPDADHPEQVALEAAVLGELNETFAREHRPADAHLYGLTRVQPRRDGLTLHLRDDGVWEDILDLLLPEPDPGVDTDDAGAVPLAGIPGLRCRALPKARLELYRPGTTATVTLQLPKDAAAAAKQWIAELPAAGDPMRNAADWTDSERAALPAYQRWAGDPGPRSRILRRMFAFRGLPKVALIDVHGQVPTDADLQQLLAARNRPLAPTSSPHAGTPRRLPAPAGRPLIITVTSGHLHGQGAGGLGRTTVAAELARATAGAGRRRVLLVDSDPNGHAHLQGTPPPGLSVERPGALDPDYVRQLAAADRHDIVILDTQPADQTRAAELADYWLGVAPLWQQPSRNGWFLVEETLGADGRRLPDAWDENWLTTMRAHRWDVRWRVAPRDFDGMFAPFPAQDCAGILLLGEREHPGTRAADYLQDLTTDLPLLPNAIPYADRTPDGPALPAEAAAYESTARILFG